MKVILLQDVRNVGKKGETVEVSDGYARNFIIPRKLGIEANAKNLNDQKLKKAHEDKVEAENLAAAQELAEKLAGLSIDTTIKSGKDGKTFGSVSSKEIAEALKKQHGIDVDKKKIVLDEPIRSIGSSIVKIKLHKGVTGQLTVRVREEK